jgi:hypothetical protein
MKPPTIKLKVFADITYKIVLIFLCSLTKIRKDTISNAKIKNSPIIRENIK